MIATRKGGLARGRRGLRSIRLFTPIHPPFWRAKVILPCGQAVHNSFRPQKKADEVRFSPSTGIVIHNLWVCGYLWRMVMNQSPFRAKILLFR